MPKISKSLLIISTSAFLLLASCDINNPFMNKSSVASSVTTVSSETPVSSSTSSSSSVSSDSSSSVSSSSVTSSSDSSSSTSSSEVGNLDTLSIHFFKLGNSYEGDSIYIKAGDKDILIDAGSRHNSSPVIENYVDTYCTDNTLEYVILTHGDQDHVEGFSSTSSYKGIFDYYVCSNIIDNQYSNKTTAGYKNYISARDDEVASGAVHHTADYYFTQNDSGVYMANSYNHIELTSTISMDILYNYYYFNKNSDENNYSVSIMLNQGTNHFMLTGDLELEGETKMAEYYTSISSPLPHCKLFKAGHHGSKTSSNEILLSQITPEICVIPCVAGTEEYTFNTDNQFPTQDFITRIAKYTTNVYLPVACSYDKDSSDNYTYPNSTLEDQNGNIIVSADSSGNVSVSCSNNSTKLKDSSWFTKNVMRTKAVASGKTYVRGDDQRGQVRTWPNVTSFYN